MAASSACAGSSAAGGSASARTASNSSSCPMSPAAALMARPASMASRICCSSSSPRCTRSSAVGRRPALPLGDPRQQRLERVAQVPHRQDPRPCAHRPSACVGSAGAWATRGLIRPLPHVLQRGLELSSISAASSAKIAAISGSKALSQRPPDRFGRAGGATRWGAGRRASRPTVQEM